jgi:hypothetical protein
MARSSAIVRRNNSVACCCWLSEAGAVGVADIEGMAGMDGAAGLDGGIGFWAGCCRSSAIVRRNRSNACPCASELAGWARVGSTAAPSKKAITESLDICMGFI